jgi:2-polyprenyl-6-methoxyphenol hydroxylase-like FAD-dependent oxidoreductase
MASATKEVQAWADAHARLREVAETSPGIALRHDTAVVEVGQDERWAWAVTAEGRTFGADVVIGADGHRSIVRRALDPNKPDATFAGYVIWLGLAEEAAIPVERWPREVAFLGAAEDYLLGYPLLGRDGSLTPGATARVGVVRRDVQRPAARHRLRRERRRAPLAHPE